MATTHPKHHPQPARGAPSDQPQGPVTQAEALTQASPRRKEFLLARIAPARTSPDTPAPGLELETRNVDGIPAGVERGGWEGGGERVPTLLMRAADEEPESMVLWGRCNGRVLIRWGRSTA